MGDLLTNLTRRFNLSFGGSFDTVKQVCSKRNNLSFANECNKIEKYLRIASSEKQAGFPALRRVVKMREANFCLRFDEKRKWERTKFERDNASNVTKRLIRHPINQNALAKTAVFYCADEKIRRPRLGPDGKRPVRGVHQSGKVRVRLPVLEEHADLRRQLLYVRN